MPNIKKSQGLAILLLTFCWFFEASAVGSALGVIAVAFPESSKLTIQFALMGPYITAMIFSPVSGWLANRTDKRNIALIGLLIYSVAGTAPFFADSMTAIVIAMLITGVGVGLVMPITNAYIYERYGGESRDKMLGYTSAFSNGATIVAAMGAGYAVAYGGWRACFLMFIIVFLIFLYCLPMLPKSLNRANISEKAEKKEKAKISKLPKAIFAYMFFIILLYIIFSFANSNFSMYIISNGWGDASQAGLALACMSIGAIAGGLLFPYLLRSLGRWFIAGAVFIFGISYAIFILADGILMLSVGGVFSGFGSAIILPYFLGETARKSTPEQADLAYGFVMTGINIGAGLCPFVQAMIATALGSSDLNVLAGVSVIILAISLAGGLIYAIRKPMKEIQS